MSNNKSQSNEKFRSKIGGQALIEGIMMLGPNTGAMACRLPDGTIDLDATARTLHGTKRYRSSAAAPASSHRSQRATSI